MAAIAESLAMRPSNTYADYMGRVGEHKGLHKALEIITQALKNADREDL